MYIQTGYLILRLYPPLNVFFIKTDGSGNSQYINVAVILIKLILVKSNISVKYNFRLVIFLSLDKTKNKSYQINRFLLYRFKAELFQRLVSISEYYNDVVP